MTDHTIIHFAAAVIIDVLLVIESFASDDRHKFIADYALGGVAVVICFYESKASLILNLILLLYLAFRLGRHRG